MKPGSGNPGNFLVVETDRRHAALPQHQVGRETGIRCNGSCAEIPRELVVGGRVGKCGRSAMFREREWRDIRSRSRWILCKPRPLTAIAGIAEITPVSHLRLERVVKDRGRAGGIRCTTARRSRRNALPVLVLRRIDDHR